MEANHSSSPFQRHFLIPFSTVPSRVSQKVTLGGSSRADVLCRCVVNCLMISANTRNDTCIACVLLGSPGGVEPATLLCCGQHMRALQPAENNVGGILSRALPPAPGHPGDLQELQSQGLLNTYEGRRNCCQGTWLIPGGVTAALSHLLNPELSGQNPVVLVLQEGAPPLSSVLADLMQQQPHQQQQQQGSERQDVQQQSSLPASASQQQHAYDAQAASEVPARPAAGTPSSIITILGDDAGLTAAHRAEIQAAVEAASSSSGNRSGGGSAGGVKLVHASLGPLQLLASQCITLVHHYLDLAVGPSATAKPKFDPADPWLDKIRPCRICYPPGMLAAVETEKQQQHEEEMQSGQQQQEEQR